jgi:hypothetical protein
MTASKPLVIDIYYGDQVQDFAPTKAFGIVGVIHKASEGTGFYLGRQNRRLSGVWPMR